MAGSREERMAATSRRLLRRLICAPRSASIAAGPASMPPSTWRRMSSRASSAPGSFRSASWARSRSRGEVGIAQELASVEEIAADVADRALDFAFRLGAVGPAGADAKAPVRGEAQELRILEQLAAGGAVILEDDALHLIEEELVRNATE